MNPESDLFPSSALTYIPCAQVEACQDDCFLKDAAGIDVDEHTECVDSDLHPLIVLRKSTEKHYSAIYCLETHLVLAGKRCSDAGGLYLPGGV